MLSSEPHRDVLYRGIDTFTAVQWLLIDPGLEKMASSFRRDHSLLKRKEETQYTRCE